MRSGKRFRIGALLIALIGLVAVAVWRFVPREPQLLDRATPIITWPHDDWHAWLPDGRLLRMANVRGGYQYRAIFLDPKTRAETSIPALDKLCAADGASEGFKVSPDGKWLLWIPFDGEPETHILKLDGSRQFTYDVQGETALDWLDDSRHWVHFVMRTGNNVRPDDIVFNQALIHTLEPSRNPGRVPVRPAILVDRSQLPAVYPGNRILVPADVHDDIKPRFPSRLPITEYALTPAEIRKTGHYAPRPPEGSYIDEYAVSPQGDRIAWVVTLSRVPPLRAFLHRFLRSVSTKPLQRQQLWISRLDGSGMRNLGEIEREPELEFHEISSAQWLPDNRHVSFLYRKTLYTVPVD